MAARGAQAAAGHPQIASLDGSAVVVGWKTDVDRLSRHRIAVLRRGLFCYENDRREVSSETSAPSRRAVETITLLVAQRLNRVELGRFERRSEACKNSYTNAKRKCHTTRFNVNNGRIVRRQR